MFQQEIRDFLKSQGVPNDVLELSVPPEAGFGEFASAAPLQLARKWSEAPRSIATRIVSAFGPENYTFLEAVEAAGAGFLNFRVNYTSFAEHAVRTIERAGGNYGRPEEVARERLLVEHTSVNPNKEWHVGHLRNAVLGDVLVRLARLAGRGVEVQNYIDDTGRQAAEAVYALEAYAHGGHQTEEKFDHYVGRFYVRLNSELSEEAGSEQLKRLQEGIERVLRELEDGAYRELIEKIVHAQLQTAVRLGIRHDLLVWESDILRAKLLHEALALLKRSPRVFVPTDGEYAGALVIRLAEPSKGDGQGDGEVDDDGRMRVLVRSNGLPTYTGKDIAYMLWKFGLLSGSLEVCDWRECDQMMRTTCPKGDPFLPQSPDRVVNVVAEHQALQQQTVIQGLAAAGFEKEAMKVHHLSYGMVSQSQGRISGRKGSGIAADDVLDEAVTIASERVLEKQSELDSRTHESVAEAIAVGAVRYLMIQYGPAKSIVFDIRDVVSFEGNTGLYIQYAIVRMAAVLRRAQMNHGLLEIDIDQGSPSLLTSPSERALLLQLARFPAAVDDSLRTLGINLIAEYAHDLASDFSQFYRDCPVLQAEADLRLARLRLVRTARIVLTNVASVIGIPLVEYL